MSIFEGVEWGSVGQWVGAAATTFASFIALRTSNNAYKAFMLDKRPCLALEDIQYELVFEYQQEEISFKDRTITCPEGMKLNLFFKNIGKTIINYEVKKIDINLVNIKTEIDGENFRKGGRILPTLIDEVYCPFLLFKMESDFVGTLDFTIVYYRDENEEKYEWIAKVIFLKEHGYGKLKFKLKENKERIISPKGINKIRMILGL